VIAECKHYNPYIARVTGNHPTSTGPISIAAIRTQVLVFSTSVPGIMQLEFQAIPKNLMHRNV
jgi:hypothetical protein